MSGYTTAGTCLAVSAAAPATFDQVGYEALTWTGSGEVMNFGEQGAETEVVTYTLVCSNQTKKRLGTTNEGQQTFEAIFDSVNPAQVILEDGRSNGTPVSVRVSYSDGDVVYYQAYVTSNKRSSGGASDLIKLNTTVEIEGGTVVTVTT